MNKIKNFFYSKQAVGNRIKYKILGLKISKKNKKILNSKSYRLADLRKKITDAIQCPDIKVVSFDIFDTLLVRPALDPQDIFVLLADRFNKKFNIDFIKMRLPAEAECGKKYATIFDIYEYIKNKYGLSEEQMQTLLQEEIALEKQLLTIRQDTREFYELAIRCGKTVIAISDMYLPADVLEAALTKNGFTEIKKVYVSNAMQARKDEGDLFTKVVADLKQEALVHIGDNYRSDFEIPSKMGIKACFYPKILDIVSGYDRQLYDMILDCKQNRSAEFLHKSLITGFVLNQYWVQHKAEQPNLFDSLTDFANLFLAPYLCYMALWLQNQYSIQTYYKKIYFIARDGYLPQKVYDLLNDGSFLTTSYVYASRIAYWTGIYSSFSDLLYKQEPCMTEDYTLQDFLKAYLPDVLLYKFITDHLSSGQLSLPVRENIETCDALLRPYEKELKNWYESQKKLAGQYYRNIFKEAGGRILVFDTGYSGSISGGLTVLAKKPVDKIYIHETGANIVRDMEQKTCTYIIKNGIYAQQYTALDLLLEECFSPLEGTCIGFTESEEGAKPVLETVEINEKMQAAQNEIQKTVIHFAAAFKKTFGSYLYCLHITDINHLIELFIKSIKKRPRQKNIFQNIVFTDRAVRHVQISLADKIRLP